MTYEPFPHFSCETIRANWLFTSACLPLRVGISVSVCVCVDMFRCVLKVWGCVGRYAALLQYFCECSK